MEPVKLLERAASGAAQAVRHPIASAAYAAGLVRGVAEAAVHLAAGHGEDDAHANADLHPVPAQRPADQAPTRPGAGRAPSPPAPQRAPSAPHESFATEPKASSRDSAHGGPGNDAEIDNWAAETADEPDIDIETPVGTTGADAGFNPDTAEADLQQPGTEPLMDPGTAKAIRKESEMLRKDAERDPE